MSTKQIQQNQDFTTFVKEIKNKILSSQYEALKQVNKELIELYWSIGQDIVQKQKEFVGIKGFSVQKLWNMRQFYLEYHQNKKLQTLSREISWSHNLYLLQKCKDELQKEFYIKSVIKFG